jgi:hypothetical protein
MKFIKAKPLIALCLCLTLIFGSLTIYAESTEDKTTDITITLNGIQLNFDVDPYLNNDDRTMVEARSISEAIGGTISWDGDTETVTIEKDDSIVIMVIGETSYTLDGATKTMDTEPVIINGRTMVPVRFISEALGQTVEWDSVKEVVRITNEDKYSYTIITTGQKVSYDNEGNVISPSEGDDYYGQDATYVSAEFSFTDNGDGTVTDNNSNLMWQVIPCDDKMTWDEAVEYCENLELGGYDDWRMPTVKELFSISDFETGWPYLDTNYFDFPFESTSSMPSGDDNPQGGSPQGDSDSSEMLPPPMTSEDSDADTMLPPPTNSEDSDADTMLPPPMTSEDDNSDTMLPPSTETDETSDTVSKTQGQFWSSNYYLVGTTHDGAASAFGVNHATGHIKAYPADTASEMGKYVRAVRGDEYGVNDFEDNGDGTITDEATGLMWMQDDAGVALEWDDALAYAENAEYAGYDDWRLPDVKELQSIVDYSGTYPAIDDSYFNLTALEENEFYYYWTNTSAYFSTDSPGYGYAWYVAFGYAVDDEGEDTHGAGAVRFSPKYEESSYIGEGGDNILNSIRLVRNVTD